MFPSSSSASQRSSLRGHQGHVGHQQEAQCQSVNPPPYLPSPHLVLHQATRYTSPCTVKIHTSSTIGTGAYTCPFHFTALLKEWNRLESPSAPPRGPLFHILGFNSQLCPKPTSANLRKLLEVLVQLSKQPCCCTWEQQLFFSGSKKVG